jgi:SAM-dependent methyltransferase
MSDADLRAANRARWRERSASWGRAAEGPIVPDATTVALLDVIGAAPGQRILDLASGTGDPSIPLAARIAPEGVVLATDQSKEMLDAARRRVAGVAAPLFVVATMEELPYPDRFFDGAACRFGIMFPPDRVAAAREARRVLKPGARIAYSAWGPLADNAMFATVVETVRSFSHGAAGTDSPQRHALGAPGALRAILEAAGFRDVEERELRAESRVPVARHPWQRALGGEFSGWAETLDDAARAELDRTLQQAFARYRDGEHYRLPTHARLGIGTAP